MDCIESSPAETTRWSVIDWFAILAICLSPALVCFYPKNFDYDMAILWEAAYRVSFGQIPYTDFGIPVGPVSILPAIVADVLLPNNLDNVRIASTIIGVCGTTLFAAILVILACPRGAIFLGTAAFALLYADDLVFPWYNNIAFVCTLGAIFFVLLSASMENAFRRFSLLVLAGAFCAGAILSKQDYGGLTVLLLGPLYLVSRRPGFADAASGSVAAIIGLAVPLLVCLWIFNQADFLYWFNYGQSPHSARVDQFYLLDYRSPWLRTKIAMLILLSLLYFISPADHQKPARAVVALSLLAVSIVVGQTSGRSVQTTTFYIAVAIAFCYTELWAWTSRADNSRSHWLPAGMAAVFVLATPVVPPVLALMLYVLNPGHPLGVGEIRADRAGLPAFGRIYLPKEAADGLRETERNFRAMPRSSITAPVCPLLNMSEYAPIYADLHLEPCRGWPLWFDEKVAFFPRERSRLIEMINAEQIATILVQVQSGTSEHASLLASLRRSYDLKLEFPGPRRLSTVFVFARRS